MSEETVIIKGYQPSVKVQNGKERAASTATPVAMTKVIPPKGGTGETALKQK